MSNVAKSAVYKCSGCNYMSNDRSNMVRHVDVCLTDASTETIFVEIQIPEGGSTNVLQGRLVPSQQGDSLPRGPFPLRKFAERLLATSVGLDDVKERIEWIYDTVNGNSIRRDLLNAQDGITLFHKSLHYIMGYVVPKKLKSVYVIESMKGKKYLAWKSNNSMTMEELSKASCLAFLREAYQTFHSVMVAHALKSTDKNVRAESGVIGNMCARVVNMKHPSVKYDIYDLLHGKKKEKKLLEDLCSIDEYFDSHEICRDILLNPV